MPRLSLSLAIVAAFAKEAEGVERREPDGRQPRPPEPEADGLRPVPPAGW